MRCICASRSRLVLGTVANIVRRDYPGCRISPPPTVVPVVALSVEKFGDRPLDVDTARRALSLAGFDLIQIHLREVSGG